GGAGEGIGGRNGRLDPISPLPSTQPPSGVVVWACPSRTFTREIEEGWRLHPDSVAWDSHAHGKLDERAQPVPGNAWFRRNRPSTSSNSVVLGEHGTVLSMLRAPRDVERCRAFPVAPVPRLLVERRIE